MRTFSYLLVLLIGVISCKQRREEAAELSGSNSNGRKFSCEMTSTTGAINIRYHESELYLKGINQSEYIPTFFVKIMPNDGSSRVFMTEWRVARTSGKNYGDGLPTLTKTESSRREDRVKDLDKSDLFEALFFKASSDNYFWKSSERDREGVDDFTSFRRLLVASADPGVYTIEFFGKEVIGTSPSKNQGDSFFTCSFALTLCKNESSENLNDCGKT